jgi:hypothetical protein
MYRTRRRLAAPAAGPTTSTTSPPKYERLHPQEVRNSASPVNPDRLRMFARAKQRGAFATDGPGAVGGRVADRPEVLAVPRVGWPG